MGLEPVLYVGEAGRVQVRHRSDGGVAIGVPFGQQRGELRIFDQPIGLILAHPLFILHDAALGIELGLRDRAQQMAHPVRFQEQRAIERAGRHRLEIIGAVEPGRPVPVGRADILEPPEERPVGIFRSIEHQMLEQMGKARLARRFVARSDMIPDRHRHHRRLAIGMDDDTQPVLQPELLIRNIDLAHQAGQWRGRGGRGSGRGPGGRLRHGHQGKRGQADQQWQTARQGGKGHERPLAGAGGPCGQETGRAAPSIAGRDERAI